MPRYVFTTDYRYTPKPGGLSETERTVKLARLLQLCVTQRQITKKEAVRLFDAGIKEMQAKWEDDDDVHRPYHKTRTSRD